MSLLIMTYALGFAQGSLTLALCLASWRTLRGPRAQDRVLALDTLYVVGMLLLLVSGMKTGSLFYFEAAFVLAMLGFVATVALAKFLMRGEVIE
jgi:multicomponent K+:H+ antiporter subunit F